MDTLWVDTIGLKVVSYHWWGEVKPILFLWVVSSELEHNYYTHQYVLLFIYSLKLPQPDCVGLINTRRVVEGQSLSSSPFLQDLLSFINLSNVSVRSVPQTREV